MKKSLIFLFVVGTLLYSKETKNNFNKNNYSQKIIKNDNKNIKQELKNIEEIQKLKLQEKMIEELEKKMILKIFKKIIFH